MLGETGPDEPHEESGDGVELQAGTPLSATHVWNLETPSPSFRTPGSVFSTPGVQVVDPKELRDLVLVAMKEIFVKFPGPLQFLNARYDTVEKK